MTRCPHDEDLLDFATGGASEARAHVDGCAACQTRLAALRDDLALLRTALRDGPLPVPRRRARHGWIPAAATAATAAAAAAALVITWTTAERSPVAPDTIAMVVDDTFAQEIDDALFPGSSDRDAGETFDAAVLVAALNGGSVCADPFGCDVDALYGWDD